MTVPPFFSDTGSYTVPDNGELSYNGVIFGALLKTKMTGNPIMDNASRTVKAVEWTLEVDGFVTLGPGEDSTSASWKKLRQKLDQPGGQLKYVNKGFGNLVVNAPGGDLRDISWGPRPRVLEFTPLGGYNASLIKWSVTTTIPELATGTALAAMPIVQFNEDISVSYDEDCYSRISITGTLEIPMTRKSVNDRTLTTTVDAYRSRFLDIDMDPTRFRVTRREFKYSRDKRTCEWDFLAEELPPMGLPVWSTSARGTFSVRPLKQSYALFPWLCSLRCTYTIRKDMPRRAAWAAFIMLLMYRMSMAALGDSPTISSKSATAWSIKPKAAAVLKSVDALSTAETGVQWAAMMNKLQVDLKALPGTAKAFLIHFGYDEGLYLDSKTITFEASWRLFTTFESVLIATGTWRSTGMEGGKLWSQSMKDIQGWRSWMTNSMGPDLDVIVDLGGGDLTLRG